MAIAGAGEDADPDYLLFLRHLRPHGKSYVLEIPAEGSRPAVRLKYEAPATASEDSYSGDAIQPGPPSPPRKRRRAEAEAAAAAAAAEPSAALVDEDYRVFLDHARVVDGRVVLELGGLVIRYEVDSGGGPEMEEGFLALGQEEQCEAPDGPAASGLGASKFDWVADPVRGKEEEEKRGERDVAAEGSGKIEKKEISSSQDDQKSLHLVTSGPESPKEGIWPKHIISRSDSEFKRRLVRVLCKPYDHKEYEELLYKAIVRKLVIKHKHLRNDSIPYTTDELGKSFFDHYPDLAEQVESSNHAKGLALLRGFFFWLENVTHDGSFCPWRSASKGYKVFLMKDSDDKH